MTETAPKLGVAIYCTRMNRSMPEVLLIQRGKEPGLGKWAVPGGGVQLGEDVITAALRELYEETGLRATSMDAQVVGISEFIQNGWHKFHVIVHIHDTYGELHHGDDATDAHWFPLHKLPNQLLSYTGRIIKIAQRVV